jgi:phosphoribosyl 1,2-cyclic phosphodiesterase
MIEFFPIASGSSGNAYCIGAGGAHFLIDAGISGKRVKYALQEHGIHDIHGIFITHEHRDHISGAGVVARMHGCPIFATADTWVYFRRHNILGDLHAEQQINITAGGAHPAGAMTCRPFSVSHDAVAPVGYIFEAGDVRVAFATDLGVPSEDVAQRIAGADLIVIEANHDPEMLSKCRYPYELKRRVASARGHLSNAQAGGMLAQAIAQGKSRVILAHLSEESNTHMLAMDTVRRILDAHEVAPASISVAERHMPGEMLRL